MVSGDFDGYCLGLFCLGFRYSGVLLIGNFDMDEGGGEREMRI